MPSPLVSFRAPADLVAELSSRGDTLGSTALRDIRRYYDLLELTLSQLDDVSEAEWNYLRDILNGTYVDVDTARMLWAEILDADPAVAERWGIDQRELAERVRALPIAARLAICDAVERWWRQHAE